MIDIKKQYRTRDGREVRIYATDGGSEFCVHGAILFPNGVWHQRCWPITGVIGSVPCSDTDLIEVKPRIKRKVWINWYRQDDGAEFLEASMTKAEACDVGTACIACVEIDIDVEEGHGLSGANRRARRNGDERYRSHARLHSAL